MLGAEDSDLLNEEYWYQGITEDRAQKTDDQGQVISVF